LKTAKKTKPMPTKYIKHLKTQKVKFLNKMDQIHKKDEEHQEHEEHLNPTQQHGFQKRPDLIYIYHARINNLASFYFDYH
jgi:hypothetical protein